MCERVWRIAQDCAKKQGLVAGSRGCKPPDWCTHAKHARSWRVAPAVTLQDKSPRLARPFARRLNSRLNPVARSSYQNILFRKNWLFTFLLTLLYIYPYAHDFERASRENFERETLKKTRLTHPQSLLSYSLPLLSSSPLSNPWDAHYQNLFSPYPFLWEGCLVLWEAVRKEPISHWLMLWSSSGIWKARKEIGSAQPRWSKKLGGLRYIG